jgi:L-2-hydroxyglutarate oxidase
VILGPGCDGRSGAWGRCLSSDRLAWFHGRSEDALDTADVIVIGAGAIGASVAYHLARARKDVVVLEKEKAPGLHQSGRNSGVIHVGYNIKPNTVKARFCVEGSHALREYCGTRGIATRPGGILVVARHPAEESVLDELERRAVGNDVSVARLDGAELRHVEPNADGTGALWAKEAMSVDARGYVDALVREAASHGARFVFDRRATRIKETTNGCAVTAGGAELRSRVVVNAAGLYADELAKAHDMRVVPFRGYYAELEPHRRDLVRSHIYAAPDLTFPFLGVHLSKRTDGRVIVGPGAMWAFGREAYSFWSVRGGGFWRSIAWPGFWRMIVKPEFRRLIASEVMKSLSLRAIWREARSLVPALEPSDLVRSFAGNRAQLVKRDGSLVDDIVIRGTDGVIHVLNVVSPGLTCSLPFGRHLAEMASTRLT